MSSGQELRDIALSPCCVPKVGNGPVPINPQNMSEGLDRLSYLEGLAEYLNLLLAADKVTVSELSDLLRTIPCADLISVSRVSGGFLARVTDTAKYEVGLQPNQLRVTFENGGDRWGIPLAYEAGENIQAISKFVSTVAGGTAMSVVRATPEFEPLGDAMAEMIEKGLVEELEHPSRQNSSTQGDWLSWLGHASIMFGSDADSVWIDPVVRPRISWTDRDGAMLFSETYADSVLIDDYGPGYKQLGVRDLPVPSAVCLTHPDIDHVDVGTLMLLPENVPILIPKWTGNPWDVDLSCFLKLVLGEDRRIISIEHGASFQAGSLTITAMPFRGEFPNTLCHKWNCYLVKGRRSAVALLADSKLHEDEVEFLNMEMHKSDNPLTVCSFPHVNPEYIPGWREGIYSTSIFNRHRLYSWYQSPIHMFSRTQITSFSFEQLRSLRGLKYFVPYAAGSTPPFRIPYGEPLSWGPISSMSRARIETIDRELGIECPSVRRLPIKYGQMVPCG